MFYALGYLNNRVRVLNLVEDVLFITINDKKPVFWTRKEIFMSPQRKELLNSNIGFVQINGSDVINNRQIDNITVVESNHPRSRSKTFLQVHIEDTILPISEAARTALHTDSNNDIPFFTTLFDPHDKKFRTIDLCKEIAFIRNFKKQLTFYTRDNRALVPLNTLELLGRLLDSHFELTDTGYLVNTRKIEWIEDKITYGDIHFLGSQFIASMSGTYIRSKYGKYSDLRKMINYTLS